MKSLQIISDYNIEPFERILKKKQQNIKINKFIYSSIFSQLNTKIKTDYILIMATAESLFSSVNKFKIKNTIDYSLLNKEINNFVNLISNKYNDKQVFLLSFCDIKDTFFSNLSFYKNDNSESYLFNYINNKISDKTKKYSNIHIIDQNKILLNFKKKFFDYKFFIASKSLYNLNFYIYFAKFFLALIKRYQRPNVKLILLDLDDTLWGGTLAECGWKKLNIGGNNIIGEAFKDFQYRLLRLKNLGIQLGIVSKNDYKIAIEAIEKHPEMILKKKDFAIFKINQENKANNIIKISEELNLTTDSFAFYDNSNFERKNVKERIPNILVPDLSGGPITHSQKLSDLQIYQSSGLTSEDTKRTEMYRTNLMRNKLKDKYVNKSEWIKNLKIKVVVENFKKENEERIVQLFNKTNQMNLRTNRYSLKKLKNILKDKNTFFHSFRVSDKFGDYGLTGLILIKKNKKFFNLIDFVMSCRVTGRGVEEKIVDFIYKKYAKKNSIIFFKYKKTKKNLLIFEFLENSPFLKKIKKDIYKINYEY